VRVLPDGWMQALFAALAVLALGVAFGFFYRVCITLFFAGFTYVELCDKVNYLNHYYLISVVSGLMIFMPLHRAWSFDAWRRPHWRAAFLPAWPLHLLRFQAAVVYFFAGVAKLNPDWLFEAQPLRIWLAARADLPLVGPWLAEPWVAYAAAWFGAAFDCAIPFLLLAARTRAAGYALVVVFHLLTAALFPIGMFPWVMMVTATVFFAPDWPRRLLKGLLPGTSHAPSRAVTDAPTAPFAPAAPWRRNLLHAALALHVVIQLLLPLRPYLAAEPRGWSVRHFNFAWQVMIVEKTGFVEFHARDRATGRSWRVPARDYITRRQETLMALDPHMIRDLARHIARDLESRGFHDVAISATAYATLNGRPAAPLIRPDINLAASLPSDWIVLPRN